MEESDSTNKVTPYELAKLASRICPERCASEPQQAIAAAQRLLVEAKYASALAETEEREDEEYQDEVEKMIREARKDWAGGIKEITGEGRRDRAIRRFIEFMEHELPGKAKQQLSVYKRDGFTLLEIHDLKCQFTNWKKQPKRKKGKQGQVKNPETDARKKPKVAPLPKGVRERLGRSDSESE